MVGATLGAYGVEAPKVNVTTQELFRLKEQIKISPRAVPHAD